MKEEIESASSQVRIPEKINSTSQTVLIPFTSGEIKENVLIILMGVILLHRKTIVEKNVNCFSRTRVSVGYPAVKIFCVILSRKYLPALFIHSKIKIRGFCDGLNTERVQTESVSHGRIYPTFSCKNFSVT